MSNVIKNVLDSIREWNEDRRFSNNFRKIRIIDREITSTKECIVGTTPNEYTTVYIGFLNRKLKRLFQQRVKATQKFNRVVDSFRS